MVKHKLIQAMRERDDSQPLGGMMELDDADLGGEASAGKRGRGAARKTPSVAAAQVSEDGRRERLVTGFILRSIACSPHGWGGHLRPPLQNPLNTQFPTQRLYARDTGRGGVDWRRAGGEPNRRAGRALATAGRARAAVAAGHPVLARLAGRQPSTRRPLTGNEALWRAFVQLQATVRATQAARAP